MEENFEYDIRVICKVSKSPSPIQNLVFIENMGCIVWNTRWRVNKEKKTW
jgi:hypothetical protein